MEFNFGGDRPYCICAPSSDARSLSPGNPKANMEVQPESPIPFAIFRVHLQSEVRPPGAETWDELARHAGHRSLQGVPPADEIGELIRYIRDLKFIPGGRYLYYAGRPIPSTTTATFFAEEDTREDWANLSWKSESCLMTGGGIGVDYSVYREAGALINRTGGHASGPLPKMEMINEIGRRVMQGGSRRSAIYASLNWQHADALDFLYRKDWEKITIPGTTMTLKDVKAIDFNWPAPLDMTNISLNYDDAWLAEVAKGNLTNMFRERRTSAAHRRTGLQLQLRRQAE
jgi:ribonucleoside-diphosphate reductase alpha chain